MRYEYEIHHSGFHDLSSPQAGADKEICFKRWQSRQIHDIGPCGRLVQTCRTHGIRPGERICFRGSGYFLGSTCFRPGIEGCSCERSSYKQRLDPGMVPDKCTAASCPGSICGHEEEGTSPTRSPASSAWSFGKRILDQW